MRLVQITQRAVELQRAIEFYSALLRAEPKGRNDEAGWAYFELDSGVRLMLSLDARPSTFLLQVDNTHETLEMMAGAIEVVVKPYVAFAHDSDGPGPHGQDEWQTFLRDSEGNTIGLVAFQRP